MSVTQFSNKRRAQLEAEASLIARVACRLAEEYMGIKAHSFSEKVHVESLWSDVSESVTRYFDNGHVTISLALHELFAYEKDGEYFYAESIKGASGMFPAQHLPPEGAYALSSLMKSLMEQSSMSQKVVNHLEMRMESSG
ncbi:hypothetical protein [Vibrio sp. Hal054]|uniref:hypothetical protein n=1 Tax=Vibrio sp. Hal054 TaxID=3035158 RepID=UPI00301B811E